MSLSSVVSRVSYTGNGAVDTYSYTFKVFDQGDLLVTVSDLSSVETTLTIGTDYTVTGVGETSGGSIALVNASQAWLDAGGDLLTGFTLTIRRVSDLVQTTDIRNNGDFYPETHEDTFDKLVMLDQQQQDEIDRSIKLPETVSGADFDTTLPSDILDSADKVPVMNATGDGFAAVSAWPSGSAISGAAASAAAAAVSAAASAASAVLSDASADAALVSETAAAASAASAAAQLASAFFRDVVYITSADSPRTITSADNGKLFNIDSSGGAISFTLPTIASTTLPFNIAFKLTTAGNTVTINRASTDTIEGATTATMSTAGQGLQLVADTDGSPDSWTSIAMAGTVLPLANGGTNATTKAGAFDSLSPMTTGGDMIYGGASGTGTRLANGSAYTFMQSNGGTAAPSWQAFRPPTIQKFTSGSGTYALPTGPSPIYIRVRMVGGGGGGTGSGTAVNAGTSGGNTTFGTSLLVANGGSGSGTASIGGAGGTASLGTGPIGTALTGGSGASGSYTRTAQDLSGGSGAPTPFGGGGNGSMQGVGGSAAPANTGAGGGGGGMTNVAAVYSGGGGGAGGFVDAIIGSPSSTYAYAVGAAGSGGSAGTSGAVGYAGGSGYIEVTEYYQ